MKLLLFAIALSCSIAVKSQTTQTDAAPVQLTSLQASFNGSTARLDWKVFCSLQYAKFEIQRSSNGVDYATINIFEADRLRCAQPFEFTDASVNGKVYYRIKVGDVEGRFAVSKMIVVYGKLNGFEINSITPSIVSNNATISISSPIIDKAEIAILNFQGTVIKRMSINLIKGTTELPIELYNLAKGNYILSITNKALEKKTTQFSKM
jgi:hypothetical protein